MATDKDISDLAHQVASHWMRDRIHYASVLRKLPTELQRLLDELEHKTRGDERRCICLAKKYAAPGAPRRHDAQCPAFVVKPVEPAREKRCEADANGAGDRCVLEAGHGGSHRSYPYRY